MFFLRLLLWQLLLKLLNILFLNRSYPGTPPFRCRKSRPCLEEPRLKTSFYPTISALAALFLHCLPMVTLTSLPALSPQHTEVELYYGRRRVYFNSYNSGARTGLAYSMIMPPRPISVLI